MTGFMLLLLLALLLSGTSAASACAPSTTRTSTTVTTPFDNHHRVGSIRRRLTSTTTAPLFPSSSSSSSQIRGGAAASKTMTAAQMETFRVLSGGMAGTVAACLTNPLEVIKTQLQQKKQSITSVVQRIVQQDGPAGFMRGLPPTLLGIIPSRSAYFYVYARTAAALAPYSPQGAPSNALVSGLVAGLAGNTLTNPIWMVRTRMQLYADAAAGQKQYGGYAEAISVIWKEEGIKGFYKGIQASYWGCTEGAIQFLLYEQCKKRLRERRNRIRTERNEKFDVDEPLGKATIFWSAAAAKMIAAVLTYPHEVARTRMREQARLGVFKYSGMWQTLRTIAVEEGRSGLYSGMGVHLIKVVPNSALMFLTYEVVRNWLTGYTIVDNNSNRKASSKR